MKPNPEQFARVMLWHLSGLRAEMAELHVRLARMEDVPMSDEELKQWQERTNQLRDKIYLEALELAGLEENPPSASRFD